MKIAPDHSGQAVFETRFQPQTRRLGELADRSNEEIEIDGLGQRVRDAGPDRIARQIRRRPAVQKDGRHLWRPPVQFLQKIAPSPIEQGGIEEEKIGKRAPQIHFGRNGGFHLVPFPGKTFSDGACACGLRVGDQDPVGHRSPSTKSDVPQEGPV
jgi:hypothetical protein